MNPYVHVKMIKSIDTAKMLLAIKYLPLFI